MATIVFADGVAEIKGSRRGLTFDVSQAGNYVKKRPSPINSQTNDRMITRRNLKEANAFFWALMMGQKILWTTFATNAGITGPYGSAGLQRGCAGFFSCAMNARAAEDPFPVAPGAVPPIVGPTITALVRIDKNTIRATFNPSPIGAQKRIYLRQALPGPGVRRWSAADGYIAEYSPTNANSTFDFTPKFSHLTGWFGRYWVGTQNIQGGRSVETQFDITS